MAIGAEHLDDPHRKLGRIAAHLAGAGVEFVVIGGWSVDKAFPDIGYRTDDIDFVVAQSEANHERLAAALNSLGVREPRGGIPMKDPAYVVASQFKTREHWRFYAADGILDVMSSVGVIAGYDQIVGTARLVDAIAGSDQKVLIADPKIVYVSKKNAGRPKDDEVVDALKAAIEAAEGAGGMAAIAAMEAAIEVAAAAEVAAAEVAGPGIFHTVVGAVQPVDLAAISLPAAQCGHPLPGGGTCQNPRPVNTGMCQAGHPRR